MMLSNPKPGTQIKVWYRSTLRDFMPLHGKVGVVVRVSRGKPRNHVVEIDGEEYAVPFGNLMTVEEAPK
jgi:hypothetical protein